ncbi:MAG: hypothetical protein ACRYGI_05510 [Janthinobacterium lividum]
MKVAYEQDRARAGHPGTTRPNPSWPERAESEFGVLSCQCLSRRIADKSSPIKGIAAWQIDPTKTTPGRTGNSPPPTRVSD